MLAFIPLHQGLKLSKKKLSPFKTSRGTVQFPLNKPIPFDLVKKIVRFRVRENEK
jgi:uncharacterized protein YdhG (YjbR/CyaY superfamily)